MSQTDERLLRCFQAVFPDLDDKQVPRASTSNVSAWDSIATTNLVAVIEEEFGIQFAPADIEKLNSFQAFSSRLRA
jgi:acyl carrier protein